MTFSGLGASIFRDLGAVSMTFRVYLCKIIDMWIKRCVDVRCVMKDVR